MKVLKPFLGCPDGHVYPILIKAGKECPPELEEAARALGALEPERGGPPPDGGTKSKGAAPENKSGGTS